MAPEYLLAGIQNIKFYSNLLVPENFTGWSGDRDPAYYMVTIHKAEDLPNTGGKGLMASMKKALKADADATEYVDPFVTVAFAGMQVPLVRVRPGPP